MLSGYRVLDLTDEKGFLCGKIFGDLGADVIKVERAGGDPARRIGPFLHGIPDRGKSLHWFAFNSSKRGITLNPESLQGQEIFRRLSDRVDVVVESFPPGTMDDLGLAYSSLSATNPRLIMVSITPFGQTGPYRDRKASDIILLAMSGLMSITGDSDRPPVRMCLDQSYCLAGAHAAVGTLLALRHRQISGEGQHVDVSMYECAVRANYWEPSRWEFLKTIVKRMGNQFPRAAAKGKQLWHCKDGYVTFLLTGSTSGARMMNALVAWMDETGRAGRMKDIDWNTMHLSKISQEELGSLEEAIGEFFLSFTMDEIEEVALKRGIPVARVNEIDDITRDEQLAFRKYWDPLRMPGTAETIGHPAFPFLTSVGGTGVRSRAPMTGEHNEAVYGKELGLPEETLSALREGGVI